MGSQSGDHEPSRVHKTRDPLHSYRTDINDVGSIAQRAAFYARCSVFEDLAYGVEAGDDKFVTKSLAGLEWLFPA
jgi:hypothetical protein